MSTTSAFRRMALALTDTVESAHMNHPDFRRGGRIFATIHPDSKSGALKLTLEQQERMLEEFGDAFEPANGAWGRQGWTNVRFSAIDADALGEALTLAWQNIGTAKKPERKRQRVGGRIRESVTKRR